jgi:hypothetical protein
MVKSGALTASQLGNGFYKFDAKPSEKMVSTAGFIDYNNNNEKDAGEPNALTLSADADKSTLNSLTTLVTESSKSEQEIANLFGLTVAELNSDTSLSNLEVQKRVVLANAIVKQVQSGSSSVATTTASAAVVTATATPVATTTPATSMTTNVLPSLVSTSTTVTTATPTATATPAATATATPAATATPVATVVSALPTLTSPRGLRGDASSTPPSLPSLTSSDITVSTPVTDSNLPILIADTSKYDDLLSKVSAKVNSGDGIYTAVASVTGNESLKNLENASDSDVIRSINTALLTASTTTPNALPTVPVATPVYTVPVVTVTPVPTATVTPVPTATVTPVPTATSTPVPTATPTPISGIVTVNPDTGLSSDFFQ